MKNLLATFVLVGAALSVSACSTGETYDSGANYATERTAGDIDAAPAPVQERVFREVQTK